MLATTAPGICETGLLPSAAMPLPQWVGRSAARLRESVSGGCSTRQVITLAGLAGVGAALRLAWVLYAARTPEGLHDPAFYSVLAESLADGDGYTLPGGEPTAYYPVGYPAALGVVYWAVGVLPVIDDLPLATGIFQLVLGVLTIVLTFTMARIVVGPRVALVSAGIVALFPNLIFHTAVPLTETLFTLLVLVVIVVACAADFRAPSRMSVIGLGLVLGLSMLVRPVSLGLLVALAVGWRLAGQAWRPLLIRLVTVAAVAGLVIVPWTARNLVVMDAPVAKSTNVGDNVCIGSFDGATGGYVLSEECSGGYEHLERPAYETERNSGALRHGLSWAARNPHRVLALLPWKIGLTFEHDHDGLDAVESYGGDRFIAQQWRDLLASVADGWFFACLALWAIALPSSLRGRDPRGVFVFLAVPALIAPVLLTFGDARFHVPIIPLLAVGAGATLERWWRLVRVGGRV